MKAENALWVGALMGKKAEDLAIIGRKQAFALFWGEYQRKYLSKITGLEATCYT